jgi:phosphatidylethanolamine-binding protein (PEBP) family uncharacterized protein
MGSAPGFIRWFAPLLALALCCCGGESDSATSSTGSNTGSTSGSFTLTSTAAADGGVLPKAYTCDGARNTPPLAWSNAPSGMAAYAVVMSTIPGPGTIKYNWLLYNIGASVNALAENTSGVGTLGSADDGAGLGYAPPCSAGGGTKYYTFTVYALSAKPDLSAYSAAQVTGDVLLKSIAGVTLGSTSITLSNTRFQTTLNCENIRQSFAPYAAENGLAVNCDDTYAAVSSYGIQTRHPMMKGITQTILQVPVPQNFTGDNAWHIPLAPAIASSTTTAVDGPIGIAVNGVPIFNP